MVKKLINYDADADIPLFTLGDMRLLGLQIPTQIADGPDTSVMVIPREVANKFFKRALEKWRVPEEETVQFIATSNAIVIQRVLQIHQYLRLIFPGGDVADWLHAPNDHFDRQTPLSVILSGEITAVFTYLDNFIFDPWSPYINPLRLHEDDNNE